jgi:5-oxoprolinase (ATP-hydrolysing)
VSFKLVRGGVFDEGGITTLLEGTRALRDNLSDLRAQAAANARGIVLVQDLIAEYSLPVVAAYMGHIQANAEAAVREMLVAFSRSQGLSKVGTVTSEDQMDDGTPIKLAVTIDRGDGSAIFDFGGTGPQVLGNTNAPPAVTKSAIIYALRCMVTRDIPLNHGCMAPVDVRIPEGSLLAPSREAAVVGGNVLTSQRVTDVVLKAFKAAAASQGCMNNFTFGDPGLGYYETIAGGAGAGPHWHGRSGVHTHMTNTRITDPEIFERRYPVVLHQFRLRKGSGGSGRHRGGDGVVREVEFLRPLTASILSERRAVPPFGLLGGYPGARGVNLWIHKDGRVVSLGGKASVQVDAGDRILILTPGGGGYGEPTHDGGEEEESPVWKKDRGHQAAVHLRGTGSVAAHVRAQETA